MKRVLPILLALLVSVCVSTAATRIIQGTARHVPAVAAAYTPYTAGFDGANDFMAMNGSAAAFPDGKAASISFWIDMTGGNGSRQDIFWTASDRFVVFRSTTNTFNVAGYTTGGTKTLDVSSSVTKTATDGWVHVLVNFDLAGANSANCHFWFDGVEDTSDVINTFNDNTVDFDNGSSPSRRVGAGNSGLNKLNAYLCELLVFPRVINDPTKFRDSGTAKPISVGSDGSTPDGSKPALYFSRGGSGNSWNTESANGYTWTITGSLDSPSAP